MPTNGSRRTIRTSATLPPTWDRGAAMDSDVLVVGAGIAGAAAGFFLAAAGARVTVLEMEDAPDKHATGRAPALYSEYFGPPEVRALTAASRDFLADPPPGFAAAPL